MIVIPEIHFPVIAVWFRFTCGEKKLLKREKVCKCFAQECLKNFILVFTSLKMHEKSF